VGIRDKLRRLSRAVERDMIVFTLHDGTVARFYSDEFATCFVHELERGRRHYFGEDPGPAHPMVEALRHVSEEEMARIVTTHGTAIAHFLAEDEIMRGLRERPGPPVRETSPGVYE
jgi:hypothetical protein